MTSSYGKSYGAFGFFAKKSRIVGGLLRLGGGGGLGLALGLAPGLAAEKNWVMVRTLAWGCASPAAR